MRNKLKVVLSLIRSNNFVVITDNSFHASYPKEPHDHFMRLIAKLYNETVRKEKRDESTD